MIKIIRVTLMLSELSISGWATQSNTTLARSNELIATKNSVRFTGNHQ